MTDLDGKLQAGRVVDIKAELEKLRQSKAIGQSLDRFIPERFRSAHTHHVGRPVADGTNAGI